MARQVLPIVGAVVGSFIPGVGPQLGFAIGSLVGNVVDPVRMRGPSIGEGQATTTQEGLARPIVWGAGVVGANIIDRGELKKSVKRSSAKGGPTRDDEQFHLTYALRICEGPIQGVVRIWENEKLVYDIRPDGVSQISTEDNSNYAKKFRLYLGDEEQMPDSALEAIHGLGNTPAYRGTAYIVFENADVTHTGGAVPTYRFEVLAGGGEVKHQGSYLFSNRYRGVETDDGWDIIENVPPIVMGTSGGLYKTYVVTNDGKFILAAGSTTVNATVYKLNPDTLSYELLGTIKDVIPDYPEISGVNFATRMVISDDGSTIVVGRNSSNRALRRYTVLKYNGRTESFTYADTFNAEESVVSSLAIDSDGSSFVAVGIVGSNLAKFFLSGSGMRIGYKLLPQGADFSNNPQIIIPSGEKSFVSSVVSFTAAGDRIGYTFTGVTPYDDTHTYARPIKADFPGYSPISGTSNAPMYYVESKYGGGKVLFFMRSDTTPYHFILVSYEIVSGIPVPGIPALIPKIEYRSPDGWGWIETTTGGNFRDITAMSGTSQTPGNGVRFYKFKLDYDSGVISLEKYEDYTTPIGNSIAKGWYYQLPVSASQANTGDGISYQWFVNDVLDRSDLPPEKYATDELADYSIRGVVAAEQYTAGEIIRSTQPVFPVDVSDYDRVLHFTKRGKPAVAAITVDDMVDGTYDFTRNEALEYPRKLNLIYQHQRTGYVAAKATVERISPDVRVSGETTTQVPVVMDENQAAQSADILLKTTWTDLEGEVKFSVPGSFDFLTVGDCVAIYPRSGQQYRMRIETIERADGRLDIKGKIDRQNSYNSQVTGLPIPDPTPPPPTTVGPTRLAYLDIPALTDADDSLVYYVAVNGETEAWNGAETQRRIVPDDFEEVASSGRGQCVGTLDAALGSGPEHYADIFNSVYVYFPGGEMNAPQSVTDEQLLREQNVLAISRDDGSAELVQFRDVEDLGDGHYKLSYLLRGRLYTGVSTHSVGATVTLLDYGVSKITVDAALLDSTWQHRAVSFGESPETAPIRTDTFTARSQVEFPPGLLAAERDGSDLVVSWSHAFRFGSDVHPVDSVNRIGYYLEVTDGSGTVSSTLAASAESATVDISSLSGPLTVSLMGVNRYTGNGLPSTIEID